VLIFKIISLVIIKIGNSLKDLYNHMISLRMAGKAETCSRGEP